MKARTGFQSGYSMSGYLVVGHAGARERRSAASTRRCARAASRPSCATSTASSSSSRAWPRRRSHDRLLRADGRPCPAAVRRRRLRARRRARRRDAPPRHARDGPATRRRRLERSGSATARARQRGGRHRRLRAVGEQAHARARRRRPARALAGPGRAASGRGTRSGRRGRSSPTTRRSSGSSPRANDGHYLIGGRGGRLDRSPHKRPTGQAGADDAMLETFASELARRMPGTAGGVWRGSWSSFYDFTPDGNPVIDQVPGPPQSDHRDGHVGSLLQARAVARPRHRRAGRRRDTCAASTGRSSPTGASPRAAQRARRGPRARMIGGVLLAAGAGTRFRAAGGDIKLLAPVDGRPLVERALAALAAAPLGDRVIVLGAHADELLEAIDLHGARPVRNEHWERGMASSLQAGLAALDPACTAARRRARRRAAAGGRGDPPRGRGGRGRRRPRRGDLRRRAQRPSRRHPARALGAAPAEGEQGARVLGEPCRARRLQRPAGAGRRRHAGRSAGLDRQRELGPACAARLADRCAARALRRRSRPAP